MVTRPNHSALLAAFLAVCVVLLGLAGVSPRIHEQVCAHFRLPDTLSMADHHAEHDHDAHGHAHPDVPDASEDDHVCAVTLFTAGCDTPSAPLFAPPPRLHAAGVASFHALLLERTLRGPQRVCGPPALA